MEEIGSSSSSESESEEHRHGHSEKKNSRANESTTGCCTSAPANAPQGRSCDADSLNSAPSGGRVRKELILRKCRDETSSDVSDSENECRRKHRRKLPRFKKLSSHSECQQSSEDESDVEKERTVKRGRKSYRIYKKEKHSEKHRDRSHSHKGQRHKHREHAGRTKSSSARRSVISGKKINLKVEKSKEDRLAETNRNELLKFLNASYD